MLDKIKEILEEQAGIEGVEITPSTTFEELEIDSLDLMQVIMEVESEFDITVDEREGLKTIGDLMTYIENQKK